MMKPLYKQPLIEAAILASGIMCTVLLIHGVQNFIAMGGKPATSQIAEKSNPDLVQVAAGSFPLGDTCNRPGVCSANNYSSDDPPIINPGSVPEAYDLDRYAVKDAVSGTHAVSEAGYKSSELDGAGADMYPKLCTMFGNTFPKTFTKATKHRSNAGDNNTPSADGATVFEFTLPAGTPITVPVSGRNILHGLDSAGNGPEGMIMYAEADRFAFQIGRKDFLKNIWIYVMDVNVDPGLLSAYQSANAAGRDKLPEVTTGQVLATSRGTVRIGVRDVGKLLDLRHIYPWDPGFITSLGITKRCTQDTSAPLPDGGGPGPGGAKLAIGDQTCKVDSDCLSNRCEIPPGLTGVGRMCLQGRLKIDDACTYPDQCETNNCLSETTGKCAPAKIAPAGTSTVSGTITSTGTLLSNHKYKVIMQQAGVTKSTSPLITSSYSIAGVSPGSYQIFARLFSIEAGTGVESLVKDSDIVDIVVPTTLKQDFAVAVPAAAPPPATGLPDWVTNRSYCYDTSKVGTATCQAEGYSVKYPSIYCKNFGEIWSLDYLPLEHTQTSNSPCTYAGREYLPGGKSTKIEAGQSGKYGAPFCVYSVSEDGTNFTACKGNWKACEDMCRVTTGDVEVRIFPQHSTEEVRIRSVKLKLVDDEYEATKTADGSSFAVRVPANMIKRDIITENHQVITSFIVVSTGKGYTATNIHWSWPITGPAKLYVPISIK